MYECDLGGCAIKGRRSTTRSTIPMRHPCHPAPASPHLLAAPPGGAAVAADAQRDRVVTHDVEVGEGGHIVRPLLRQAGHLGGGDGGGLVGEGVRGWWVMEMRA